MPRRVSKRLAEMTLENDPKTILEQDWMDFPDAPMRLTRAKVLKRKSKGTWVRLCDGSEELICDDYWGVKAAVRAGTDPIPPVGAWLEVMIHGLCPWKIYRNSDGKLRVDVHHWQKDPGYCKYESGYRSLYDAENGMFAVPAWEMNKEKL